MPPPWRTRRACATIHGPAAAVDSATAAAKSTRPPRDSNWIGKVLAVAGVAVTLIGVVLLLVLAAQAGILRPEIRVGAGVVLAGALVAIAVRLNSRPADESVPSHWPRPASPRRTWT